MMMSTAYHPQTDGQSERTNQTVEIMLRYIISEDTFKDWPSILPHIQAVLNNSTSSTTGISPNEIVLGFKIKEILSPLHSNNDFIEARGISQKEALDALIYANSKSKVYYDRKHEDITGRFLAKVVRALDSSYQIIVRTDGGEPSYQDVLNVLKVKYA